MTLSWSRSQAARGNLVATEMGLFRAFPLASLEAAALPHSPMSGTINKTTIVGDVSADTEIRKMRAGKAEATFSVARSTPICHFSDENNRMERNIALQIRRQEAHDDRAEETGQVLEWNPATDKIVSDHGFAGEACRAAAAETRAREALGRQRMN
jgi:hypothetical protein